MSQSNIDDLIGKAHEFLENSDLTNAMEIGKQIMLMDSENPKGLEIMGYILLEMNCLEEAKFCFSKSIENEPCDSHVPFLYLGQLTKEEESEKYFLRAIDIMNKNLSDADGQKIFFKPSKLDISNAYVSLCELYLTDLCDKENAEQICHQYVMKAIEIDESNPAAWQSLASLHLVKNETDSARTNIEKSISLWLPSALEVISTTNEKNWDDSVPVNTCDLSAELRTKCAEILFELAMLNDARSVLETVLAEDEEHFQAHYLMALVLEVVLETAADGEREELVNMIEDHAEMAMNLADPEVESEAVTRMMQLLEKVVGDRPAVEEAESMEEDSSESEEEEN